MYNLMCSNSRTKRITIMCTRKQAMEQVVKDQGGSRRDLRKKIGHFYESFVMLGIIQELLPEPDSTASASVTWKITAVARQNAVLYGIEIE